MWKQYIIIKVYDTLTDYRDWCFRFVLIRIVIFLFDIIIIVKQPFPDPVSKHAKASLNQNMHRHFFLLDMHKKHHFKHNKFRIITLFIPDPFLF